MGAIEQLEAEPVFQLANLLAYRGLSDVQLFSGAFETARLADDPEAAQRIERREFHHKHKYSLCVYKKLSFVEKPLSNDNTPAH
nr:hypothetical protein [Natronospirillum sp.]